MSRSASVTAFRSALKIEVPMTFKKATPGTFVFEAADPDAPVTTLYIRKTGMPDGAPKTITVTVGA